jgi:hypothetical protein
VSCVTKRIVKVLVARFERKTYSAGDPAIRESDPASRMNGDRSSDAGAHIPRPNEGEIWYYHGVIIGCKRWGNKKCVQ